jgi:malonyl-CoA O-methyltransferase
MPAAAPERSQRRPVDAKALALQQRRLNRRPDPPWLHAEVARRMAERLPAIRLQPRRVLDWNAFLGASQALLREHYPAAEWQPVETDPLRLQPVRRPWWSAARWGSAARDPVPADRIEPGAAELLWANMALHFEAEPQALLSRWQQAIAVDGFLMFSTLGPGTLGTLGAIYREAGWPSPLAPLVDMHDLGDMLVQAGFADPVMDQETLTLTWSDAAACLAELRSVGGNAAVDRHAALRTPRWRSRLEAALREHAGSGGRIALPFEIVYGHAFRAAPRVRVAEETRVAVEDLRTMARRKPAPR